MLSETRLPFSQRGLIQIEESLTASELGLNEVIKGL